MKMIFYKHACSFGKVCRFGKKVKEINPHGKIFGGINFDSVLNRDV